MNELGAHLAQARGEAAARLLPPGLRLPGRKGEDGRRGRRSQLCAPIARPDDQLAAHAAGAPPPLLHPAPLATLGRVGAALAPPRHPPPCPSPNRPSGPRGAEGDPYRLRIRHKREEPRQRRLGAAAGDAAQMRVVCARGAHLPAAPDARRDRVGGEPLTVGNARGAAPRAAAAVCVAAQGESGDLTA